MTLDFPAILITLAFASQILVCSFLSAWRLSRLNRLMRQNYPPAEYPRLYPIAPEKMQQQYSMRMALRITIGVAAVLVLAISLLRGTSNAQLADNLLWVCFAQMLPMLLALPHQLSIARALRSMPAPAVRSAELRSWRLTDFVAPVEIALGIALSILPLAVAAWFYFQIPADHSQRLGILSIFCGLLLLRMFYVLLVPVNMPRPDPYMSDADLFRSRRLRMQVLFRIAMFMGVYTTFLQFYAAGTFHFDRMYIAVGVSFVIQLYSTFWIHRIIHAVTDRDLAAYRADAAKPA